MTWGWLFVFALATTRALAQPPDHHIAKWQLPHAHDVQLGGGLGEAYRQGVARLSLDPYRSVEYLRSDLSFEVKRPFTNYSGDISGRFLEIACLTSPPGTLAPDTLPPLIGSIPQYQMADGHFGRDIDFNQPLEPENPHAVILPVFWGHSRLLVGLLEAHRATSDATLLDCAKRIGDFYITTADRFLDPAREAEYRGTGSYAAGYVTDYFPAIEGLVRLYGTTHDERYLEQAERMADFFQRFDTLPIDHSHANLITHHGLVLLYEATGKQEYLQRARDRWQQAWEGGYVWPTGGVGERFRVAWVTDEGCSEADWLRLSLDLWRITGETLYLQAAERLLLNHYEMNRTANGGFGHHNFVCDETGPLLMQPQFTEAVWCCTFHGLLGLHTLKNYMVAGSEEGLYINFPLDVSAHVQTPQGVWKVTVKQCQESPQEISCLVRIDHTDKSESPPPVHMRKPDWADHLVVTNSQGAPLTAVCEHDYLRLPVRPGAAGEVKVTFGYAPRLEDRRLRRIVCAVKGIERHHGVVLRNGPWVLLAPAMEPRPTVVLSANRQGQLSLSPAGDHGYSVPTMDNMEGSDHAIRAALTAGPQLKLATWQHHPREQNAAFVFDVAVVAEETDAKIPEIHTP
ncbi:MAG: beta-L-arabinofuranosidase domain-containing protein [Pirellulaceae bacterium]